MDLIDIANDRAADEAERQAVAIRTQAAQIPAGEPGECAYCGELKPRLVNGACARCRDQFHLP